jgi:hypothetical protein
MLLFTTRGIKPEAEAQGIADSTYVDTYKSAT